MMKVLDRLYFTYFQATLDRGSRFERAAFLLWFSSSFALVAFFYFTLTILSIRIGKPFILPMFILVFAINYFSLQRIYIKSNRCSLVVGNNTVKKGYVIFARFFVFFSIFMSMAIMLAMMVYYGKNVGFL